MADHHRDRVKETFEKVVEEARKKAAENEQSPES